MPTEDKPAAASAPATAAEEDEAVDASAGKITAPVIDKEWDEDDWDAAAEDVLAVRFLHIRICAYV